MAVPTVGTNLVSVGSAGAGTTLAIVLTAAVAVGDVLAVAVSITASQTLTATDSKGNTYVNSTGNLGSTPTYALLVSEITKALVIGDTITITIGASVQGAAAAMIQLTGVPQNQTIVTGYAGIGSNKTSTSTSASSNALATTKADDCIFLFIVGTQNAGALLATDFTSGSVDSGYTRADSAVSALGTSNCGVALCYKTVAATPPSQSPTFTLNASRQWVTNIVMMSGFTARGAKGTNTRAGEIGGTTYRPTPENVLGKVSYKQNGKSVFDGWPQPVITPQNPKVGQQVSDGLLLSD